MIAINGKVYSWASLSIGILGERIIGVTAINYRDVGEIGEVRGAGPLVLGRTRGKVHGEGDMEMLREEWDALLPKLTGNGLYGYQEIASDIMVARQEGTKVVTDRLPGARFHSAESSNSEGTDAAIIKVTLSLSGPIFWGIQQFTALRSPLLSRG